MNTPLSISIDADTGSVDLLLRGLLEELAAHPLEVRQRFVGRFEGIAQPFCLDADRLAATGARNILVVLQPADALLELVRALRAGELDVA